MNEVTENAEKILCNLPKNARLFFIGIGGVSMSALAVIAREKGYFTGGSDRAQSDLTEMLRQMEIPVFRGHAAEHVEGWDAVIYNAAIHDDNPELFHARELGLPCIYRADFLAFLMKGFQNSIGVAGMHGKSTTSAMLSHLFLFAGRDPSILIGAPIAELGRDFRSGKGGDFIFEACEYRDSFLSFRPSIAVVLNEEMDHPDWFHSMEQVHESFRRYLAIPGKDGYAVVNCDDADVAESVRGCQAQVVTFGIENEKADFRAVDIAFAGGCASFDVLYRGAPYCKIRLSVPGLHNVSNALACCAAAHLCGIGAETVSAGLASFTGAGRRMEYKGTLSGCAVSVPVYDDFGHHPTEIKTTLEGAKRMGFRRLRCVYQPHTYSRTAGLFEEFCHAFDAADEVMFADIYAAREQNTFGISSADLAARIPNASYRPDWDELLAYLQKTSQEGDMLVIMGAGDIAAFAERVAAPVAVPLS